MEGAVVNYAGGAVQPLLGKLGQLLGEAVRLLRGVRGEVAHFRDELATMNAVLRTLTEAGDNVDHLTREWMKQVRELAFDAEDCIDVFELRISRAPPTTCSCTSCLHVLATLGPRRRLATDIKALRARALVVSERRTRYSVDRTVLDVIASYGAGSSRTIVDDTVEERARIVVVGERQAGDSLDPAAVDATASSSAGGTPTGAVSERQAGDSLDSAAVDATASSDHSLVATAHARRADGSSQYVGIEDQTTMMANWVREEAGDAKLKMISIGGLEGVGKTTLATEVCRRVRQEFQVQASVSVSRIWDLRDVLRRILKQGRRPT